LGYNPNHDNSMTHGFGDYAFHCDTFSEFIWPSNGAYITDLGSDAFTGVNWLNNCDLTPLKYLNTLGEWDFYAAKANTVVIPSGITTVKDCEFTWSDVHNIYWNIDNPNINYATPTFNFFLTSIDTFHISVNANQSDWNNYFSSLNQAFYIKNVIADINADGSIAAQPNWTATYGNSIFTQDVITKMIDQILSNSINVFGLNINLMLLGSKLPWIMDNMTTLMNLPIITGLVDKAIASMGNTKFPWIDRTWFAKMLQCEIYCIWDRYVKALV
jgi:hypothetical protein